MIHKYKLKRALTHAQDASITLVALTHTLGMTHELYGEVVSDPALAAALEASVLAQLRAASANLTVAQSLEGVA